MKTWRILYDPAALADLDSIYFWVASNAGVAAADRFVGRLLGFCDQLRHFPKRGAVRDDIMPGARLIGFEKSVSIAFLVDEKGDAVRIFRLLYRGRRLEA